MNALKNIEWNFLRLKPLRARLAVAFPAAGFTVALFLAWSSWNSAGCYLQGCSAILEGPYSRLGGVPLGLYAAVLWTAILLLLNSVIQWVSRILLAVGGGLLLIGQLFLLAGFCPLCAVHSFLAVGALFLPRTRAPFGLVAGILGIALLIVLQETTWNETPSGVYLAPHELDLDPAFYSHGAKSEQSPWLIVSFTCSHCWTKLDELAVLANEGIEHGPGLIFLTNEANRAVTTHILSGILSSEDSPARSLGWLLALPEGMRWQILRGQSGLLLPALEERFPGFRKYRLEASSLLDAHRDFIEKTGVPVTPFLLTRTERLPRFSLEEWLNRTDKTPPED